MLKFIKQHLSTIDGIAIYPLISFVIFFLFFIIMAIWVFHGEKNKFSEIENIPLDNK